MGRYDYEDGWAPYVSVAERQRRDRVGSAPEPAPRAVPGPKRETVSPRAMFEEDALTHFAASKRDFVWESVFR